MKKQDKKFSQYFYEQNFRVEKQSTLKNEQSKNIKKPNKTIK